MKKESFTQSLPFRLLVALAVGIAAGLALSAIDGSGIATALLNIIVTVKFISSQFINFCVPLGSSGASIINQRTACVSRR